MTGQAPPVDDPNWYGSGFHTLKSGGQAEATKSYQFLSLLQDRAKKSTNPRPPLWHPLPMLYTPRSLRPAVCEAMCDEPRRMCFAFPEVSGILHRPIKKHNHYQTSLVISIKNCSHRLGFSILTFQHLKYYHCKVFSVPAWLHRWKSHNHHLM